MSINPVVPSISTTRSTTASMSAHTVLEKLSPGTLVVVGSHKVEIIKYLTEGGFAHIYMVEFKEFANELERPTSSLSPGDLTCLKRVIVTDENGLNELRNEVEVMKQLRGSQNIVQYYDSNASRRNDGAPGYEVLLLMELCPNGSLLDYMNQRLTTKLMESEIIKIMYDVTRALANMHYLHIPLIHRDIKIENVLVDSENNFKLCDFGSTSTLFPVVTTHQDIAILTNNVYVHTTPQYRSPEMIDIYRCLPINEKSDIWALGIFLYKLLFFTTPFELTGQFAILHSKYEIPHNNYSSGLVNLIIVMLAENPNLRPNVYQVMSQICSIMECEVPFEDKYGQGDYNFAIYSQYQEKLQKMQYQLYLCNQSRNPSDFDQFNDLYINCMEIAPKQPIQVCLTTENEGDQSEKLSQAHSRTKVSKVDDDIVAVKQQFPEIDQLDTYLDQDSKKIPENVTSDNCKKMTIPEVSSQESGESGVSYTESHNSEKNLSSNSIDVSLLQKNSGIKYYKVTNPFHKTTNDTDFVPEYFHEDKYPQIFQESASANIESNKLDSTVQRPYFHENKKTGINKSIQGVNTHAQQHTYMPYYNTPNIPVQYAIPTYFNGSNTYSTSSKIDDTHQQALAASTTCLKMDSRDQNNSQLQSEVHQHSRQEPLLIDISPPRKLHESSSKPDAIQSLDLTFDQMDLSHHSMRISEDSKDDEATVNDSGDSVLSSESISIKAMKEDRVLMKKESNKSLDSSSMLQKSQRMSLELKFQEINLSPSPPNISLKSKSKSKTKGSTENKRSFSRARKSQDLDSGRREIALKEEGKRRSIFGLFKG